MPSLSFPSFLQAWEFTYTLNKLKGIKDGVESISKAAEASEARTVEEASKARIKASPSYMRERVERGEDLPRLEWRERAVEDEVTSTTAVAAARATNEEGSRAAAVKEEKKMIAQEIIRYVTDELTGDLYRELMMMMGRSIGWSLGDDYLEEEDDD